MAKWLFGVSPYPPLITQFNDQQFFQLFPADVFGNDFMVFVKQVEFGGDVNMIFQVVFTFVGGVLDVGKGQFFFSYIIPPFFVIGFSSNGKDIKSFSFPFLPCPFHHRRFFLAVFTIGIVNID